MEAGGGLGEGEEQAEQGSRWGGGSGQVKAGGGLQRPGSQINLHVCVFNVQAARASCRWLCDSTAV